MENFKRKRRKNDIADELKYKKSISFRLSTSDIDLINEVARDLNKSMGEVIRIAIYNTYK